MEPLAKENEKLKEAMNLSERNIQKAWHERDLAESNARDLEYQRGGPIRVASGYIRAAMEQVQAAGHCLRTTEGCL